MGFFKRILNFFKRVEHNKTVKAYNNNKVEGYLLQNNEETNKSLVLVKTSERCWTAKWFDNKVSIYNSPSTQITHIFKTST